MNQELSMPLLSADDFEALPDRERYELIDGRLRETTVSAEAGWIANRVGRRLDEFCAAGNLGWVFAAETTYQCFPNRPRLVRKPDVSVICAGRLPGETLPTGHLIFAPDLAVEVISPTDTYTAVEEKIADYRSAGVRLVWVIAPATRSALIRRLDGSSAEVGPAGVLDGEDVLPGFQCALADLFRPPVVVP